MQAQPSARRRCRRRHARLGREKRGRSSFPRMAPCRRSSPWKRAASPFSAPVAGFLGEGDSRSHGGTATNCSELDARHQRSRQAARLGETPHRRLKNATQGGKAVVPGSAASGPTTRARDSRAARQPEDRCGSAIDRALFASRVPARFQPGSARRGFSTASTRTGRVRDSPPILVPRSEAWV